MSAPDEQKGKLDELGAYALEDGARPDALKPFDARLREPVPPELDANTRAAIRRRAAELRAAPDPGRRKISRMRLTRGPALALAAAASLVVALAFYWNAGREGGAAGSDYRVVRAVGEVLRDGGPLTGQPGPGDLIEVAKGSLVYIEAGEDLVLRLNGPAALRLMEARTAGIQEVRLVSGTIALLSGPARKARPDTFRVHTMHARYALLGTMIQLRTNGQSDEIEVLEGRVAVRREGSLELTVDAGRGLALPARDRSTPLAPDAIARLSQTRRQLQEYDTAANTGGGDRMSLEEIRTLYGGLTEYRMSDGRRLRGYLVVRGNQSLIVTTAGEIPVDQNEIEEFHILD